MGRMNSEGGRATISLRLDGDLTERLDDWWEESDKFDSRSDAIRHAIREAIDGPPASETPMQPPQDDPDLERAYKRMYRAANTDGILPKHAAVRIAVQGSRQNLSKEEANPMILRPLKKRGYIRELGDWHGNTAIKLNGL